LLVHALIGESVGKRACGGRQIINGREIPGLAFQDLLRDFDRFAGGFHLRFQIARVGMGGGELVENPRIVAAELRARTGTAHELFKDCGALAKLRSDAARLPRLDSAE
jgi:hypothetical protein